ncbi:MAG: hypothetical protein KIT89_06315 [Microcella sp.]|uniref:hypothetical protein n=1 Tax=Microcella sp. TaxID=1913979 RepID=UPI0024CCB046|nr:hypothetical protein [Microcella sp.]UYN84769.1 MAG: hypothetical protein KIT89_06315 [Microcella sp.]
MNRRITLAASLLAALSLALVPATAAVAADQDVTTPGWRWLDVYDNGYRLQDVESYYTDFLGSGVELAGWRRDAFDDLMRITAFDPEAGDGGEFVPTYPLVRFGSDVLGPLPITPVSASWVDNGRTSTVGTVTADFGDGRVVTVTFTMEIENSTARWTVSPDVVGGDPAEVEIEIGGDLGSDGDSTYVDLGGGAWISHDTNRGDPVIAWRLSGVSPQMGTVDVPGAVIFRAPGTASSSVTVGVIDFDECSFDDALDTMAGLAPTLSLGQSISPLYATDCLLTVNPPAVGPGEPVAALLPLTLSAELVADNWAPDNETDFVDLDWRVDVVDGPTGVVAVLEWVPDDSSLAVRLSGTPTQAWSGPVTLVVHRGREPVLVQFALSVELAATGASSVAALAAGSVLLVGAGALAFSARRRTALPR